VVFISTTQTYTHRSPVSDDLQGNKPNPHRQFRQAIQIHLDARLIRRKEEQLPPTAVYYELEFREPVHEITVNFDIGQLETISDAIAPD
jgi:hypothetical protein